MDMLVQATFDRDSDEAWAQWDLAHTLTHFRLYDTMLKNGFNVDNYPLSLDGSRPSENWRNDHNTVHQNLYATLGLTG